MELERIGKYRILAKIGQGAMGEVFKGQDPYLNRFVAIKTISASLAGDEEVRKRFLREAQSAAKLNHPHIITVYDFGEEQGKIYMAMELLEGKDLKDLIGGNLLSDLNEKLEIMEQIGEGMAFAHANDLVHRDLKPANIHVQPSGQVKIMDFGLARFAASDMTRTGMVMGTPHYMSPEQVRGEKADARSDIFSLGAVFYELLSNHKPFDGDSMHTVLFHVLQDNPEPLRHWVDLPPILVQLVEKALNKDPALRFQNGGRLRDGVKAVRRALAEEREWETSLEDEIGPEPQEGEAGSGAPRVVGSTALDLARTPDPTTAATRRSPQTLPARSGSGAGLGRSRPPAPAPSRLPIYLGAGMILVLVVAAAVLYPLFSQRSQPPAPGPPVTQDAAKEQIGALTQALVGNQVELARKKLEDKNYSGAVAQVERALKLDPKNAPAKKILDEAQALLKDLDAAAEEARAALKAKDTDKASQAFWRLLTIDPNNPAAEELAGPLDRQFRAQAEEAQRLMSQSRGAAEKVKAGTLEPFSEAATAARAGDALLAKRQFAQAARKFLDARDGFERARRLAQR
ncbi:MAG TPA: serine/threonine-protein kinase [Vicinamibacteria bacterium]|jgi:serine/threonine protein kinase|nr:serine/threonine-protein kinase [Vicinamibacteria bacterium]